MKKILIFAFCVLLSNYLALHKNPSLRSGTLLFSLRSKSSAEVFAQKPVLAAETTPSTTPSARVSELPTVNILPDNPLYFLKTIKEKVQLLIARNASSQADLLLDFSQKRLSEAVKIAEKGKIHISEKLLDAFGKDIETAQEKINQAKTRGEQTRGLVLKLQKTIAYQKSVIEKLQGEIEDLNSFLVQVDESLGVGSDGHRSNYISSATPSTVPYDKIGRRLGIFDWLRSLLGKKEILKPLAE